jgi:signal recognition particle subunit SRP54
MAQQLAGMGGMGGMMGGGPDLSALGAKPSKKDQQPEEVDFDAIEKALSGRGPMPPGMGRKK